jgi:plasmid stability protein
VVDICSDCSIVDSMAQLNIRDFDDRLMARLKIGAAKAGKTLREFVTEVLKLGLAK